MKPSLLLFSCCLMLTLVVMGCTSGKSSSLVNQSQGNGQQPSGNEPASERDFNLTDGTAAQNDAGLNDVDALNNSFDDLGW
ncbi:hypothetical protein HZB02_06795 [Candidatus Woesearchaeota archaeon]|nr:hypothetical protein [Candidatus Woesearchaeota archaeon]